jgi:threonine dehydratase
LQRIRDVVGSIDPVFLNSPQYESLPLNAAVRCSLTLKVETANPVRCFKGRGTEAVSRRTR